MSVGDWIQASSLVAVALALFLSVRQNREVARQTRELIRQNVALTSSLQQSAYQAMIGDSPAARASFLESNPEVLAWHLRTRGFPAGTHAENLLRLYVMIRFEAHERNFLSYDSQLLTDDPWVGWLNVIKADFADADVVEAWAIVKDYYAPSFVTFVDELVGDRSRITISADTEA